jgi:hypothetical protein
MQEEALTFGCILWQRSGECLVIVQVLVAGSRIITDDSIGLWLRIWMLTCLSNP